MNSSTEAAIVKSDCRDEKSSRYLRRIPFASLAGAICFLIGLLLLWPLRTKFDNGITDDPHKSTATLEILHAVMQWLSYFYAFLILLEVSTLFLAFVSTGPTRKAVFADRFCRIAGRLFGVILIVSYSFLLLGLHSVALSASFMWRQMLVIEGRVQEENECLLYGRRSGDDWKEEKICDEAKMNALREEMKAFTCSSNDVLRALFILACGVIVNMVCVAVNCARIKNEGRATECNKCENKKPEDAKMKQELNSVEVA